MCFEHTVDATVAPIADLAPKVIVQQIFASEIVGLKRKIKQILPDNNASTEGIFMGRPLGSNPPNELL